MLREVGGYGNVPLWIVPSYWCYVMLGELEAMANGQSYQALPPSLSAQMIIQSSLD